MDLLIGESYAGGHGNEAHINVLAGPRAGPIGAAFATTLANPKPGHVPFLAVLQPNIPVVPATVLINKSSISDAAQGTIFWGAVQAGVAAGVRDALRSEEHTSELQSQSNLVCRLLLEKKNTTYST